MLVLSRRKGQRAIIAGNVQVVVLEVRGDRVKLGFEGPENVPIHREEVHRRMSPKAPATGFVQASAPGRR